MSWTLSVEGTADELRAEVHRHEADYWRHMPMAERLAVHHLTGHAIEEADEYARGEHLGQRFLLSGRGSQYPGHFDAHIDLYPLPDPPTDGQPADPGS